MTTLNVAMSLTLADGASGPLRGFTALVERLGTVSAGVGTRLESIALGISAIGKASASAPAVSAFAGSLGTLSTAMATVRANSTGVASAIQNVGTRASRAGVGTYSLEQSMGALGGTLSRISAQLATTVAGLGGLATATAAANTAARGMNAPLQQAGNGLGHVNTQATTLMTTLRGLAQVWGAMKIKDGLVGAGEAGMKMESAQTRAETAGLTPDQLARVNAAAVAGSRAVPQFDRRQAYEMAIDLRSTMNDLEGALAVLPQMLRFAYNLKAQSKDGKVDPDILRDTGKFLQQRGALNDPAKRDAELDSLMRIVTANPSVDVKMMLANLSQMKGAISGDNVSREFLPVLAALAEMNPAKAGQLGTQTTTLARYVMGYVRSGISAKATNDLGMFEDPQGLKWNSQGNIDLKKSNLRMKGASLFQENPLLWVEQFLLPAMRAKGLDIDDNRLVADMLARMFPDRNAAELSQTMVNKRDKLRADANDTAKAMGSEQQYGLTSQNAQGRWDAMTGKFRDLAIVLGEAMLPTIKVVATEMAKFFTLLSDFFTANPVAAKFAVWAAAIATVILALSGFAIVAGIAGTSLTALLGFARLPAMFSLAGAAFNTFSSILMMGLRLAGGAVTAFFAGWAFGSWLADLEVGGQQVRTWGADLIEWVVDAFRKGWGIIGKIVTGIIPGAQAAQASGAAGPRVGSGGASGAWGQTGGATGSWGDDNYGHEGNRKVVAFGRPFRSGAPPEREEGGGGSGARGPKEHELTALRSGQEQYKQDFLRSEKAVYTDLAKIEADIEAETDKRKKAALQAELDQLRAQRDEYVSTYGRIGDVQQDYADKMAAVNDRERNGQLSRSGAEAQKIALLKEEADVLDLLIEKQRQLPGGTDRDEIALSKIGRRNQTARSQLPADDIQILQSIQGGFQGIARAALQGKNGIEAFGQTIKNTLLDIVSKKLGDALFDSLFGKLLQGGGASGGGLFSWIGGLFSGLGGGGSSSTVGTMAGGSSASTVGMSFAVGTDYVPRDMLAQIHQGERIVPARDNAALTAAMTRGGGGGSVQLTVHPDAMRMTMADWLQGEMARQMATR